MRIRTISHIRAALFTLVLGVATPLASYSAETRSVNTDVEELMSYVYSGRGESVRALLQKKRVDLYAPSERGESAWCYAVAEGAPEMVESLLAFGADPNYVFKSPCRLGKGERPVHIASAFARLEVLKILLARGADPNAPNAEGVTALYGLAILGRPEVIEILLKGGADPNVKGPEGGSALDLAKGAVKHGMGNQAIVELMTRYQK